MDEATTDWEAASRCVPQFIIYGQTDSVMNDLTHLARKGAQHFATAVATTQTRGRGRMGRTWVDNGKESLLAAVLLKPEKQLLSPQWIVLAAALAAADAITEILPQEFKAQVKWPNDILINGRKCGGILTEMVNDDQGKIAYVLGLGINIGQRKENLPIPNSTSLAANAAPVNEHTRDEILAAFLRGLDIRLEALNMAQGNVTTCGLYEEYVARCATLGSKVRITQPSKPIIEGQALTLHPDGSLEIKLFATDSYSLSPTVTVTAADVEVIGKGAADD